MSTKAEDTEKNILNTARKHFLKDGFSGASLRNIVKDAGLTTGAFYKYYPTKEALFDALTDPYIEHIYQIYDRVVEDFEKLSAKEQTSNMSDTSGDGMDQMIDYIYEHYDNFRLLLKCGDSGKFETFIHNMVDREMRSSLEYVKKMKEDGIEIPIVGESLMHMIYTGFFSSIFQIIEHDIDKDIAKRNVHKLREFNTGGWERLWNVKF
ncbi:TetR/AcrR family transcriptional regulator [Agathobacter rectalis]|uniref:TetR/AcrR family transcriptional regulator n=1 Tax=Agathobacter rectalis TaxID=39491 RepID=A0A412Q6W5_9FIRM|nr:TetR/AcrR family transcriptional regulator [Agathobacter rectalis]RGT79057.1 TetR/AcrR family transcriptional regulator [Agathobacter rectalis]RGT84193.1 TetR/AcrR family transcriptional regulator [Agathobacter rectalis]